MTEKAELIRSILGALPVPVVLSRIEDGLVLYANEPAARAFGIQLDAFVGSRTPDVYADPADRQAIVEILRRSGRLQEHEVRLRGPGGATFWALASSEPMSYQGEEAICTTFAGISSRKRVEELVLGARQFAEQIVETIRTPLVALDGDLRVLTANRAFTHLFRIARDEVVGRPLAEIDGGRFSDPAVLRALAGIVPNHDELVDHEMALDIPDVGRRTMLLSARKLQRPGNQTDTVVMSIDDVSTEREERNSLIAAKAEIERRLATILRNTPGMAYRSLNDRRWTAEFLSEGCLALTGYAPEELLGKTTIAWSDLVVDEDRGRVWDTVQDALRRREPFQVEYRLRAKSGQTRCVWDLGVGVYEGDRLVALEGVVYDVSARRRAEEQRAEMEDQMRAAQRMEAIARLAGGVAHDFNNMLAVILSFAGFLRDSFREDDPARRDVDEILEAGRRAARLTSQLLAFSRRQVQELTVLDLNETVASLEKMLRRLIGEDVDLRTRLGADLGRVKADVTQVEQVVMNLVVNARDAMPHGGVLTIETANVELDDGYWAGKLVGGPPGHYVMLAVSDNGVGMSQEVKEKAFEPFFTTKDTGKGTGLGLSTVYGIVKQSQGFIWIYSEVGRGTTVKVFLPRIAVERLTEAPRRREPEELRGTETVLVVEDEDAVRRAAVRILVRKGYRVLEASEGGEALLVSEQHQGPIHVLLTDIVMPRISGHELAKRLLATRPEMRVIYTSGYTEDTVVHQGVLEEGTAFLQKPFTVESLLRKVRQALDG